MPKTACETIREKRIFVCSKGNVETYNKSFTEMYNLIRTGSKSVVSLLRSEI